MWLKKSIHAVHLILIIILLPFILLADSTGSIQGRVTDKESGKPIPGASVLLVGTTQGAMTDPDGYYLITLVKPGTYTIRVSSVSYNRIEIDSIKVTANQTIETPFEIEKDTTNPDKVIRVTTTRDKIDTYIDSSKISQSEGTIKTMPIQNVDQLLRSTAGINITSEGEIIIRGGRVGEVRYIIDSSDMFHATGGAGPMNLGLALTTKWGSIFGQVIDPATGTPIPEVKVNIEGLSIATKTDEFGYYSFKNIKGGTYRIKVTAYDYFITKEKTAEVIPDKITEVNFKLEWALRNKTAGSIRGRVIDLQDGTPISGASVFVERTISGAMTDPDGLYLIPNINLGIYSIRVASPGYNTVDINDVQVYDNQTTEVDIELEKATSSSGIINESPFQDRIEDSTRLDAKSRPDSL
jgi:protocatechuate 3,4-dioxygenase beta subunit